MVGAGALYAWSIFTCDLVFFISIRLFNLLDNNLLFQVESSRDSTPLLYMQQVEHRAKPYCRIGRPRRWCRTVPTICRHSCGTMSRTRSRLNVGQEGVHPNHQHMYRDRMYHHRTPGPSLFCTNFCGVCKYNTSFDWDLHIYTTYNTLLRRESSLPLVSTLCSGWINNQSLKLLWQTSM